MKNLQDLTQFEEKFDAQIEEQERQDEIQEDTSIMIKTAIKEILKPFIYHKYGKTYIGYKETEGALRVEGMILQLEKVLKTIISH